MVNSKPPAPELATMAPLLRRLSIERPWQPIALMVLARLGAGPPWGWPGPSQAGQPATVHRGQQNDRGQAMDHRQSFDSPGPNPLIA